MELRCLAEDAPPTAIIWRRLDGTIEGRQAAGDGYLLLGPVGAADAGVYVCEAENTAGVVAAHATLEVLDAPTLTARPQDEAVVRGGATTLPCHAQAESRPQVVWHVGGALLM